MKIQPNHKITKYAYIDVSGISIDNFHAAAHIFAVSLDAELPGFDDMKMMVLPEGGYKYLMAMSKFNGEGMNLFVGSAADLELHGGYKRLSASEVFEGNEDFCNE